MKRTHVNALAGAGVLLVLTLTVSLVGSSADRAVPEGTGSLAVVWTSGDPDVAHRMVFMYTHNAKRAGWFDDVQLIVWGPSQRLLVGDKEIESKIKAMKEDGVTVKACIACARSYGLVEKLEAMGIEVLPMGQPLTDLLKSECEVLSF